MNPSFPRFFRFGSYWINSYRVLMCVGLYVGILATAFAAETSGLSPLRVGLAAMTSAIAGFIGARFYLVLLHPRTYFGRSATKSLWDADKGGWSVLGAPLTFVPAVFLMAALMGVPATAFFDCMALGVLAGGFWIRFGCVFNGCCVGRETDSRFGVWLHDTYGVRKRRIPVQYLEMAWWAIGLVLFLSVWPAPFPPGSYALAVLGWYGVGRFFLEPLRERSDVLFGRVRVNQLVAALLAIVAVAGLLLSGTLRAYTPEPIPWSAKRALAWSDFVGQPDMTSPASSMTAYKFTYKEECQGGVFTFTVTSLFQPSESWVKPAVRTNVAARSRLLAHEQGHFDLSEVHARQLRRTLSELRDPCDKTLEDRKAFVSKHMDEDAEAQGRYDWETGYGVNQVQQGRWLTSIGQQIESLTGHAAR